MPTPSDVDPEGRSGTSEYAKRLGTARERAAEAGLSALFVSPGTDLRYLTGYEALPLERLTCLVVPVQEAPFLVVPALEEPAALASPVGQLDLELLACGETEDPYEMVARRLGVAPRLAFDNQMWAEKVFHLLDAVPGAERALAGEVLGPMRSVKDSWEIRALQIAGAAIDDVHARVPGLLRAGRTEREVGADIAAAIIDAGHDTVDFVIAAAGPNGASPHHDVGDRPIAAGEPIVVDIGGTMPDGYRSDCTRMYCIGEPPPEFVDYYGVLQAAQWQAVQAVKPGMTAAALDAVARDIIADSGFGEQFIHRTGHGIGLDTHEDPYIVAGNEERLQPGHVFSIEPGIYLEGHHGARIEDIVACTDEGPLLLNRRPRELIVVD